ncbi:hypothetical protein AN618_01590 [Fervidicola ferrireducens]|uniref:DUF1850 domain-containing protein n=1 Tax=Fervidicola ferrireducens TaxID=520764 RepID=A0A140LE46_9FIRM|nr:DUF1850 domain-containing protein [Fervidicola ferrireducens]KXG78821.1 hypothetical protein AN618_01590 [Fervidicola ferrireducens]
MKERRIPFLIIIAIVLLAGFFAFFRIEREKVLIIENERDKTRTVVGVKSGEFAITFVHSIERTPVYEFYRINDDGTLTLKEARFYSLGTGLPFYADGGFKNEGGAFVVSMSRTLRQIPLRVSPVPGHAVLVDGRKIYFTDIAKTEDLLTISAGHRFKIKRLRGKE